MLSLWVFDERSANNDKKKHTLKTINATESFICTIWAICGVAHCNVIKVYLMLVAVYDMRCCLRHRNCPASLRKNLLLSYSQRIDIVDLDAEWLNFNDCVTLWTRLFWFRWRRYCNMCCAHLAYYEVSSRQG